MRKRAVIVANDLSIGYHSGKKKTLVHSDINLTLYTGELTSLLGANGTGKSTLLRTLSGSQPALSGTLLLNDKPVSSFSEKEKSKSIGVVLTDKTRAGGLTVYELVALGRQPHTGFFGRLRKKDHKIIKEALDWVGIRHKASSYTAELSDGERQKVMIAKALVQECPLIILDEPTAFLDAVSRIEIMTMLHKLAAEQNKAILLSTHDIEQALVLSDRLWLLSKENGLESGVTEDIISSKKMERLFPNDKIKFDYDHGVYYPLVQSERKINVICDDRTTLHWVINAFNRNGYACIINEDKNDFPLLIINKSRDYSLISKGDNQNFTTFEELLDYITAQE